MNPCTRCGAWYADPYTVANGSMIARLCKKCCKKYPDRKPIIFDNDSCEECALLAHCCKTSNGGEE